MLHYQDPAIAQDLFHGNFGLEKESLRVTPQALMAQTLHPFTDSHIDKDFCENQPEINTDVHDSLEGAMNQLEHYTDVIQQELEQDKELLWPFSNPPIIRRESDIPIAHMKDIHAGQYRQYLSERYGRYKMAFSGIHYNFSFADDLLQREYELRKAEGETDASFFDWKNDFYLSLAAKAAWYGWLITALTSASPILDGSFFEKSLAHSPCFTGMASYRNSELGYWNFFTPVFNYASMDDYLASIQSFVDRGLLREARELYYPIRLKPAGKYTLEHLATQGVSHIELRMLDLNPLEYSGLSRIDARFIHLFLVWLASLPDFRLGGEEQVLAAQNFKNAAHYDLKTVKIVDSSESSTTVYDAAWDLLEQMKAFYEAIDPSVLEVIEFQFDKLRDPVNNRYAWIIRRMFEKDYISQGLELASGWQVFNAANDPASRPDAKTESE